MRLPIRTNIFIRLILIIHLFGLTACMQELYSGLSEQAANEMILILRRNNINTERINQQDGKYAIQVDSKDLPRSLSLLRNHGYPRETFESMGELFKKEGLISTPLEERVRLIHALSQSVTETLTQIDGVITARVHIVLPENNAFGKEVRPSSASVFIKYRPDSRVIDAKADIKMIVARSIDGLSYDKISVVMLPAEVTDRSLLPPDNQWISPLLLVMLLSILAACTVLYWQVKTPRLTKTLPVALSTSEER